MTQFRHFNYLFILLTLITTACEDNYPNEDGGQMPLIVEGWIEEGESPMVMVTRAVDMTEEISTFEDCVEKWGRVSVFDGEERYLLTGRINKDFTPGFVFTSSRLKGKPGHTYRLLVEAEDMVAEGISTLTSDISISGLKAEQFTDSTYQIRAYFNGITRDACYRVMTQDLSCDTRYYGAFLGTFKGEEYDSESGFIVMRSSHGTYDDSSEFTHDFKTGSRISVKILRLDEAAYQFWKLYDETMSLSQNVFFTFTKNLPSTISGGLGCWGAYGTSVRSIRLP